MVQMADADLENRLVNIGRQVRRLQAIAVCLLLGLLITGYFSLRSPLGLRVAAREFVLVDSNGGVRARWGPSSMKYATPDNREVVASTSCLMLLGRDSRAHLQACTTWDAPTQSSILLTDRKGPSLTLFVDDESAAISIGRRREMGMGEDNAKITLSTSGGEANLSLRGKRQRGTLLSLDGITVYSEDRRTLAQIPVKSDKP